MKKIGLPRALYYFQYGTFWKSYLEGLGFEVVVSPRTNKPILEQGLLNSVDGACLPLKVFLGHVQILLAQGLQKLFVPEIVGLEKQEFICTNFLGLPDLLRQFIPAEIALLRPVLDGRKSKGALKKQYWQFGLNHAPRKRVKKAWKRAMQAQSAFEAAHLKAIESEGRLKLLILGPPYLINDPYLNGNLMVHLQKLGTEVLTPTSINYRVDQRGNQGLHKPFFWSTARQAMDAVDHLLPCLDGIIVLIPFGCGSQSFISVVAEEVMHKRKVPLLEIHLDEHTSELGTLTRLEAFCDLLERNMLCESYISPFRQ